MKLTKTYPLASFKALEDEGPGKFQAVVSVFGNVDLQGDRVMPGAFNKSLAKWRAKGDPIPVVWSHDWLNPDAFIGEINPADAMEIVKSDSGPGGLLVKGTIDVHKPFAAQVFDLLKSRRVKEYSFAYDTIEEERDQKDKANNLLELDIIEVGPTLKGANPETYTVSAKSAMEAELKEAYEAQRSLTHFIDLIKDVSNPITRDEGIARMLTATFMKGPSPAKVAERKLSEMSDAEIVAAMSEEATPESETEPDVKATETPEDSGTGAESKPWHTERQGDQFCCILDADGSTVDCHDTMEESHAHIRALYANAADGEAEGEKFAEPPAEVAQASSEGTESTSEEESEPVATSEVAEAPSEEKAEPVTTSGSAVNLNYMVSSTDNATTWTLTMPTEKAGRVIGQKAAAALKARLTEAVDAFVNEVNGLVEPEEAKSETKTQEESPTEWLERLLEGNSK